MREASLFIMEEGKLKLNSQVLVRWRLIGNKTERARLVFVSKKGSLIQKYLDIPILLVILLS